MRTEFTVGVPITEPIQAAIKAVRGWIGALDTDGDLVGAENSVVPRELALLSKRWSTCLIDAKRVEMLLQMLNAFRSRPRRDHVSEQEPRSQRATEFWHPTGWALDPRAAQNGGTTSWHPTRRRADRDRRHCLRPSTPKII